MSGHFRPHARNHGQTLLRYRREDFLKEHAKIHGCDINLILHEREDKIPGATDTTNTKLGTEAHKQWTAERKQQGLRVGLPPDHKKRHPLAGKRPRRYNPALGISVYCQNTAAADTAKRLKDSERSRVPSTQKPGVADVFGSDSEPLTELESEEEPNGASKQTLAATATKKRPVKEAASGRSAPVSQTRAKGRASQTQKVTQPPQILVPYMPMMHVAVPPLSDTQSRALGLPPSHATALLQSQLFYATRSPNALFASSNHSLAVPKMVVDGSVTDYSRPAPGSSYRNESDDDLAAVENALDDDDFSSSDSDDVESEDSDHEHDPVSAIRSTLAVNDAEEQKRQRARRRPFPFEDDGAGGAKRRRVARPADIDVAKLPAWNELSPPVPARLSPAFCWDKGAPEPRSASVSMEASSPSPSSSFSSSSKGSSPFPSLSTVTCAAETEASASASVSASEDHDEPMTPKAEPASLSEPAVHADDSATLWMTPHAQRIARSCSPPSGSAAAPLSGLSSAEDAKSHAPPPRALAEDALPSAPSADAAAPSEAAVKVKTEAPEPSITELLGRFALDLCAAKNREATGVMQRFWRSTMETIVPTLKKSGSGEEESTATNTTASAKMTVESAHAAD